jgi:hypothetical protein
MRVSIYNTPLCVIPESIRGFSVSSISDWENDYIGACEVCNAKSQCGGFFSSNLNKLLIIFNHCNNSLKILSLVIFENM